MKDQKDHFLVAKLAKSSTSKKKKVESFVAQAVSLFVVTGANYFITLYQFKRIFFI